VHVGAATVIVSYNLIIVITVSGYCYSTCYCGKEDKAKRKMPSHLVAMGVGAPSTRHYSYSIRLNTSIQSSNAARLFMEKRMSRVFSSRTRRSTHVVASKVCTLASLIESINMFIVNVHV